MVVDDQIEDFWNWFLSVKTHLEKSLRQESMLKEMDDQIKKLGSFSWELGPGKNCEFSFIVSPNGNSEKLRETINIIECAPSCNNWAFFPSKQPKKWNYVFNLKDTESGTIEIDANNWEYVLLKFPDGTFDIILKTPQVFINYSAAIKQTAAEIALYGILGEEICIKLIGNIEIVKDFDNEYLGKETNIRKLAKHILNLQLKDYKLQPPSTS